MSSIAIVTVKSLANVLSVDSRDQKMGRLQHRKQALASISGARRIIKRQEDTYPC